MMMISDRELLQNWAERGDEASFRALVERHAGLVHGVASRRAGGNNALAREIGQTVFTMLARKAGSLTGHTSLASWLHRATLLEAAHQIRREVSHERRVAAFAEHHAVTTPAMSPASAASTEDPAPETPPGFDEALAGLKEADRALLLQRFFEERTYREIAAATGQNEAALRKRTERALERLASRLSRRGAVVSTLAAAGSARAALQHTAPAGYAGAAGSAALTAAPSLTSLQIVLHTLRLMTYGKSIALPGALALLLLTFGGGYSAARLAGDGRADFPSSGHSASSPVARARQGLTTPSPLARAGNPGDSPERARLRSVLRRISKGMRINLNSRGIVLGFDDPSMSGGADGFRAMAELRDEELAEAWKLLPDFRGNPTEYEGLAAFVAAMRRVKKSPRDVLEDLLKDEYRVEGKPVRYGVFDTVDAWFRTDPAAAWDWMFRAVGTGDYPFDRRRPWGEDSMSRWLGKDPAAALAALAPLPPEWSTFTRKAMGKALGDNGGNAALWSAIQSADDRTALMVAGSQPARSDWSRDTLLPWLMTRKWAEGKGPERIAHEWTWRDGALDRDRFAMLCESMGTLPTPESNAAAEKAVKEVLGDARGGDAARMLEYIIPDPERQEHIRNQLGSLHK